MSSQWSVAGVIGMIVGWAIMRYMGMQVLVAGAIVAVPYAVLHFTLKGQARSMLLALAIQVGQALGFLFSTMVIQSQASTVMLDLIILVSGVVWLLARQERGPVIFLTIYQAVAFVITFFDLLVNPLHTPQVFLVYTIARTLAIAGMWGGLRMISAERNRAAGIDYSNQAL